MYLTALMQVTRLGCEIPRSKERPTNPLMNNFNMLRMTTPSSMAASRFKYNT